MPLAGLRHGVVVDDLQIFETAMLAEKQSLHDEPIDGFRVASYLARPARIG